MNYIQGFAEIVDARTIKVKRVNGTEETLDFEHLILATGSTPAIPPMLKVDDPRVMDSTGALDLPDVPKSLLVVGGGYIGLELGSVYATLGSAVTVVEMTSGLLPGADRDLVDILARRINRLMKSVLLNTRVVKMTAEKPGHSRHASKAKARRTTPNRCSTACSCRSAAARTRQIPGLDRTRVKVERSRLHRGRRTDAHRRTVDLRDRRRRWRADARAQGVA